MRKLLIGIAILGFACQTAAQDISAMGEVIYGTFRMKSLRSVQDGYHMRSSTPLVEVADFPAFWIYRATVSTKILPRLRAGVAASYMSTGGRLDYQDYSGRQRIDQMLRGIGGGVFGQFDLTKMRNWELLASLHIGIVYSKLGFTRIYAVGSSSFHAEDYYHSMNAAICPAVYLRRSLGRWALHAGSGYDFHIHGELKPDDTNALPISSDQSDITVGWEGIRFGCGIGYTFGKSFSEDR